MDVLKKIYNAIELMSESLINGEEKWKQRIGAAKNYVCTPDFKNWTFGKSVGKDGKYHYNGGVAKRKLYSQGFVNILGTVQDDFIKEYIIKEFEHWAESVKEFPILEKYQKDQLNSKQFELLVHKDVVDGFKEVLLHQKSFDEGFKSQIVNEVSKRNRKVVLLAKQKYGYACAVCSFKFEDRYGNHGKGFIEMHHLYPMSKGKRKSRVEDLRPVCANCHRMLHRGKKLLAIDELKTIIDNNKDNHH